jgi:hypothetical protein
MIIKNRGLECDPLPKVWELIQLHTLMRFMGLYVKTHSHISIRETPDPC